ncbi:MAG: thiamine biosynthesis lipoprotein [Chloroflexi bacterium]|nr:MAG: thiamine biosynthesis lipoprotein [Chloroflexota bacterium]
MVPENPPVLANDVARETFRAMGTDVTVLVNPAEGIRATLDTVRTCFEEVEQAASRFRPHSELNRLARDESRIPSPLLTALHHQAALVFRATDGVVTPFVRAALEDAGYDRSFDTRSSLATPGAHHRPARRRGSGNFWAELDFGGVGKGWTVGRALRRLTPDGGGILIDAGGDIGVVGRGPDAGAWHIAIDGPSGARVRLRACIRNGGIATSSRARRAWSGPHGAAHHLIDPITGRPAQSDIVQATASARSTLWAEVAAKALVIRGAGFAPLVRQWLPEVALAWTHADGTFHADAAFRTAGQSCAA